MNNVIRGYFYGLATDKYRGPVAGIVKFFLFALSLVYLLAVKILLCFSRLGMRGIGCRVISVGNITLGGTGKTLLVEFIAAYLKEKGKKVAVISRGYKRPRAKVSALADRTYETMGDEPFMLSNNLKGVAVIVDKDRVRGAGLAIKEYGVDTVVFDDAFQQWRIKKDLEIVVIDSTNPFGNGHLIPRGLLRQPLSSLKKARVFILTKTDLGKETLKAKEFLSRLNPSAPIFESIHRPVGFYDINTPEKLLDKDALRSEKVTLMSAIGEPASFESLMGVLGAQIGLVFRFEDHHNYTKKDLERVVASSKDKNIETIVTTQKDAARLSWLAGEDCGLRILVLRIKLAIVNDEQGFCNRLLKLYSL